jgi:DNA primase
VATCGTALTDDHVILLKKLNCPIYVLFDRDNAGQQALQRSLSVFFAHDVYPKAITLPPETKDVDDWVNLYGTTSDAHALWLDRMHQAHDGFLGQLV